MLNSTINSDRNFSNFKDREVDFVNSPLFSMDPKHSRLRSFKDKSEIGVFDKDVFGSTYRVTRISYFIEAQCV